MSSYIICIGVDDLQHYCKPHEDKCICSVAVKDKKPKRDDWQKNWCIECDYTHDEIGDNNE